MKTISIADLKSHLSAELKLVNAGEAIMVMDRKRPVAYLSPLPGEMEISRKKRKTYRYRELAPLIKKDPLDFLNEERGDR